MNPDRIKSFILVSIQLACILLILATGPLFAVNHLLLVVETGGIALGVWSLAVMGRKNLNIAPTVRDGAQLITRGPYRFIRHPMYASVLLTVWAVIIDQSTLLRSIVGLILTADLMIKMIYEEGILKWHFRDYPAYTERTKRIIPFIF
ncbi:MAG: isoprenylcysteine carboxylmethyltransferase family protein [Deltaproteobacteria bacterium]|nr:isoprenylcysteine carboxylmethyltransferase family protein [Deltaproteobacteria bacterium]